MSTIYQFSTFETFKNRGFDGCGSVKELLEHGDIGFGTYHALDGEMIILEGCPTKLTVTATSRERTRMTGHPFATISDFKTGYLY